MFAMFIACALIPILALAVISYYRVTHQLKYQAWERMQYITYANDPVEQLFDMQADSGETKNLAAGTAHAAALKEHRKLLADWQRSLRIHPEAS